MDEFIEEEIKDMKESLEDIRLMTIENRKMIKALHTAYRINSVISIVKWIVIIGVTIGAFVYIQPYLESMLKLYGSINSATGGVENNGGIDILKALKKF